MSARSGRCTSRCWATARRRSAPSTTCAFTNLFGTDVLPSLWQSVGCATTGNRPERPDPARRRSSAPGTARVTTTRPAVSTRTASPCSATTRAPGARPSGNRGKSPIKITGFLTNVQAAKVSMPQYTDPYDQSSPVIPDRGGPRPAPPGPARQRYRDSALRYA